MRLTADEAVRLAMENNLGIQAERMNPQISTLDVSQARAVYAPVFFTTFNTRSSTQPPSSFITGGSSISDERELQPGRRASTVRAVGRRPVHALDRWVEGDDERDRQPVQPAAVEQPQRQLRAAAAAELQVRREPAADRNQQEQRDHRRPRSARADGDHDASGAQRLLRSDRRHRRPESRASVARPGARIARRTTRRASKSA